MVMCSPRAPSFAGLNAAEIYVFQDVKVLSMSTVVPSLRFEVSEKTSSEKIDLGVKFNPRLHDCLIP